MSVAVRFAPSPTGYLHIGNIRSALMNWLFARKRGGHFLLRLDDTDDLRSTAAYAAAIKEDLGWLGLTHDSLVRQSDRLDRYRLALERLKESGRAYPCFDTAEELEMKRKLALGRGRPPIYDRAALRLSQAEIAALIASGRKPHWRFKLAATRLSFEDLIRGTTELDMASISDPVLVREDGRFLYLLASVVDDIELKISHVIRGEDHVTNAGVQIEMFEALGAEPPAFAHFALFTGAGGEGLSKRHGALAIRDLRDAGIEALAILSLLATLGTGHAVEPRPSLDALVADFDLGRLSRAPTRFDPEQLKLVNAKLLHQMPFEAVKDRLERLGVEGGAAFWGAVRGNVETLKDAAGLWRIVTGPVERPALDADFLREAAKHLPAEPWNDETWGAWTKAVAASTGLKGKELFLPLRLALTGMDHGPEMKKLLPMIGRSQVMSRLLLS